jgi:addiction module HigA family antidote
MGVIAIRPGEHLGDELKELGMSAAELARKLDVPTNRITGILNGQRTVAGDTAWRPAHFFGTSAEFRSSRPTIRRKAASSGHSSLSSPLS